MWKANARGKMIQVNNLLIEKQSKLTQSIFQYKNLLIIFNIYQGPCLQIHYAKTRQQLQSILSGVICNFYRTLAKMTRTQNSN